DGRVCLTRADGNVTFPADFMLVAASNPCPCGYFGDPERQCTCTVAAIRSYQNRIGGPLMDRIDIHIDVRRLPPSEIVFAGHGTSSKELREDVLKAREYSAWRRARDEDLGLEADDVVSSCRLDEKDKEYFVDVARAHSMSGRGIVRALSIARTIADMCEKERVGADELYEALEFRVREGVGR
ncbi:MAG: ATP-binding protein, partial [Eggerthellaceae bacterium]|nr:ATP-binding protein [Eggerthellaceae bacterium]